MEPKGGILLRGKGANKAMYLDERSPNFEGRGTSILVHAFLLNDIDSHPLPVVNPSTRAVY